MENSTKIFKLLIAMVAISPLGCASSNYVFHSNPKGANVYYYDTSSERRMLLGTTPLSYDKSAMPQESSFIVEFEKDGFMPREVPIAPTDQARTLITVNLKGDAKGNQKETGRINFTVNRLFKAQRFIYLKRYQSAIVELEQILKDHPTLAQAHVMKGTAYFLLQEKPSAIEAWKKAMQIDPGNEELERFLAEQNIVIRNR